MLSALNSDKTFRGQQSVLLVQVLAHEINHGYRYAVVPCESFNGQAVQNLRHLADMIDACEEQYLNFGLEGGRLISLDRQEATQHGPQILRVHAISSDRSEDLKRPTTPAVDPEQGQGGATAVPAAPTGAGDQQGAADAAGAPQMPS